MMDPTKLSDAEILELIEPMMDRMLEGSARIDPPCIRRLHRSPEIHRHRGAARRDVPRLSGQDRCLRRTALRSAVTGAAPRSAVVWVLSPGTDDEMVLQAAFVWPDGKLLMDHAMFF